MSRPRRLHPRITSHNYGFDISQPALTPLHPTQGSELSAGGVTLVWVGELNANHYDLILTQAGQPFFEHRFYQNEVCEGLVCAVVLSSWTNIPTLQPGSSYTWQINSHWDGENRQGVVSVFTTQPYPIQSLERPAVQPLASPLTYNADGKIAYLSVTGINITNPDDWGQTNTISNLMGGCAYAVGSPCYPEHPALSPDQTRIAFTAAEMMDNPPNTPSIGFRDIYLMNLNGTGGQWLTRNSQPEGWLSWSPDGSKLAYSLDVDNEPRHEIYVYDIFTQTTTLVAYNGLNPTWSSNGTQIIFVQACALWAVNITDGTLPIPIVAQQAGPCSHYFNGLKRSPVANQYIYHSASISTPGLGLLTVHPDGSASTQMLTHGYHRFPDWSPDGSRVVYEHSDDPIPTLFFNIHSLRILTLQTVQSATISPQIEPYNNIYQADWNGIGVCPAGMELRSNTCGPFSTNTPQPTVTPMPTPISTTPPTAVPTLSPTLTPTPINRASLPVGFNPNFFAERTLMECEDNYASDNLTKNRCWVHVSVLSFIDILNDNNASFTHRALMEALIEGEHRSSIGYDAGIFSWGNEAVARQFFGACGENGCQGEELYFFLDYFQSPLNGTLDDDYIKVIRIRETAEQPGYPGYQVYVQQLENAVIAVLTPSQTSWLSGPINGYPYGYGTRGIYTYVNVSQAELDVWETLCGFSAKTIYIEGNPPMGEMFIGTTPQTDKAFGGSCSWN